MNLCIFFLYFVFFFEKKVKEVLIYHISCLVVTLVNTLDIFSLNFGYNPQRLILYNFGKNFLKRKLSLQIPGAALFLVSKKKNASAVNSGQHWTDRIITKITFALLENKYPMK